MKILLLKVYTYFTEQFLYYENSNDYVITKEFNIYCYNGYKEFYMKEGLI